MRFENSHGRKNVKRIKAKNSLEAQLKLGKKVDKSSKTGDLIDLTDNDKLRINNEIAILSNRIVTQEFANGVRTKKSSSGRSRRK